MQRLLGRRARRSRLVPHARSWCVTSCQAFTGMATPPSHTGSVDVPRFEAVLSNEFAPHSTKRHSGEVG